MKLNKKKIREILESRNGEWNYKTLSSLPHPYTLKDAKEAAQFVLEKMRNNEEILVVGDYDVDGIISSVIMMKFFSRIGYGNARYVIPNRFSDGYGLSQNIIANQKADLIITVDNGITAIEAANICKEMNIPLIITDHHLPKKDENNNDLLPNANFIINPQRQDCTFAQKEICGAFVAWYFCAAIKVALNEAFNDKVDSKLNKTTRFIERKDSLKLDDLLELVMLATIADLMPLKELNKLVVLNGIERFKNSKAKPIKALKQNLKGKAITNPSATDIAFSVTPLLNAAGRMGEATLASEFFLAQDYKKVESLYNKLVSLNNERKQIVSKINEEAIACARVYENAVIALKEDWHEGVLGIVAARLVEHFKRPAIIFSRAKLGLKGSVRGYGNIDMIEVLNQAKDILGEFGGHSKAAGVAIELENYEKFCSFLENLKELPRKDEVQNEDMLGEIDLNEIDGELLDILQEFEPYGQGNPRPVFKANLQVNKTSLVKNNHLRMEFKNAPVSAIFFFAPVKPNKNEWINAEFTLQEDLFTNLPLMIFSKVSVC